jgi:hypothetical protein
MTIVVREGIIPTDIADAACRSLDTEIAQKKKQGALMATNKRSLAKLTDTPETTEVKRIFEDRVGAIL